MWYIIHGKYWMIQFSNMGWISLGIHIDPRCRRTGKTNQRYGPYIDLHLICVIISVGIRPYLSGETEMYSSIARGGYRALDY